MMMMVMTLMWIWTKLFKTIKNPASSKPTKVNDAGSGCTSGNKKIINKHHQKIETKTMMMVNVTMQYMT